MFEAFTKNEQNHLINKFKVCEPGLLCLFHCYKTLKKPSQLTHFMPLISFDTPSENLWFSNVSRGYQKRSVTKWVKKVDSSRFFFVLFFGNPNLSGKVETKLSFITYLPVFNVEPS